MLHLWLLPKTQTTNGACPPVIQSEINWSLVMRAGYDYFFLPDWLPVVVFVFVLFFFPPGVQLRICLFFHFIFTVCCSPCLFTLGKCWEGRVARSNLWYPSEISKVRGWARTTHAYLPWLVMLAGEFPGWNWQKLHRVLPVGLCCPAASTLWD